MTKASDLFIKTLEDEGVEYIFGILSIAYRVPRKSNSS